MNASSIQASVQAARTLMGEAAASLDAENGTGYAAQHPELVASLTLTAALHAHALQHGELMGYVATSLARMTDQ